MAELTVDEQTIRYDRDATVEAYRGMRFGYANRCPVGADCSDCKNFALQRAIAYPSAFRTLLDQLGIDVDKEAEIFTCREALDGQQVYGGWFYLVGELVAGKSPSSWHPDAEGFHHHFSTSHPDPGEFKGSPVLVLNFDVRLKWVIKDSAE